MHPLFIVLIVILSLIILILLTAYICFRLTFYVTKKEKQIKENDLPPGDIYLPYHDLMLKWMAEVKKLPYEEIRIKSFDGLTLFGKFYDYGDGSPIEIMFHGYRGSAERDLCGGVQRCFALGRSVLILDQRGHVRSDGNVISFGVLERHDCLSWANYASNRFKGRKLFLTGISMGASTVLMASNMDLPKSVVGIIADCGYSSQKDIIIKTIKEMRLPPKIFYPFVKLGALLYGKFHLEEITPLQAVRQSKVPILFVHGDNDAFVPYSMSVECYNACNTPKALVTIKGAGHGMAYLVNPTHYINTLHEFETHYAK